MWILSGWNTYNYDIENYVAYYYRNFDGITLLNLADPGFNFINKTFNYFDISFETYHIMVYGILLTFIFYHIWKKSHKPILIVTLYIFTAYFGDVIQLRNFIACFFLYCGLFVLISPDSKYPKLTFVIFNLLASSIHISFVFYFVFLLGDLKIKPWVIIAGSLAMSVFGHSFLSYLSNISYIAENAFLSDRAEGYLESSSYWSVIICSCQYLIHYFVCARFVADNKSQGIDSERFMKINTWLALLIIATSINMTFFRLFRNLLLFSSIYIVNGYTKKRNVSNTIILAMYFLIMSIFHFWRGSVYDNVNLIFTNNLLW